MRKIVFEKLKIHQKRKIRAGLSIITSDPLEDRPDDEPQCQGVVDPDPDINCGTQTSTNRCSTTVQTITL